MYFLYLCSPIIGIPISSLTNITSGSINPAIPVGTLSSDFLYRLAAVINIKSNTITETHIMNTFRVIEMSIGFTAFVG